MKSEWGKVRDHVIILIFVFTWNMAIYMKVLQSTSISIDTVNVKFDKSSQSCVLRYVSFFQVKFGQINITPLKKIIKCKTA